MRPRPRTPRLRFALFFVAGVWFSFAYLLTDPAAAQVASEPSQFTVGDSQCPSTASVEREVLSLIPPERHELLRQGVRIQIGDLGESYRVTVSKDGTSVKKRYSDPARDCEGRARFAAVFAVLTVMPPELGPDAVSSPEPPVPREAPLPAPVAVAPPAPPQPLPPLAHIELAGLFADAPPILKAAQQSTFGGELRVALGRGKVVGALSIAYTSRSTFTLHGVSGDISQLPTTAGLRLSSDFESCAVSAELGLLAMLQRVRSTNLFISETHSALELGLRAGVLVEYPKRAGISPFIGTFAWFVPAPRDLSALPQGVVGNLPYLWVGGAAGVSLGL